MKEGDTVDEGGGEEGKGFSFPLITTFSCLHIIYFPHLSLYSEVACF